MSTVTIARKTANVMEVAKVAKEIANMEDTVMLAQLTSVITHVPNVKKTTDSVIENMAATGAQFVPTVSKIATVEIDVLKITTGTAETTTTTTTLNSSLITFLASQSFSLSYSVHLFDKMIRIRNVPCPNLVCILIQCSRHFFRA